MDNAVTIRNLKKTFKGFELAGVDFDVPRAVLRSRASCARRGMDGFVRREARPVPQERAAGAGDLLRRQEPQPSFFSKQTLMGLSAYSPKLRIPA